MAIEKMEPFYTANATTVGGRSGHVKSDDGIINLDTVAPGSGKTGTNPEQLFASGYSACFGSALAAVASMAKVHIDSSSVTAHVTIGKTAEGGFAIKAKLDVHIEGPDHATQEKLLEQAHQVCPYSKATRGNIEVELALV